MAKSIDQIKQVKSNGSNIGFISDLCLYRPMYCETWCQNMEVQMMLLL